MRLSIFRLRLYGCLILLGQILWGLLQIEHAYYTLTYIDGSGFPRLDNELSRKPSHLVLVNKTLGEKSLHGITQLHRYPVIIIFFPAVLILVQFLFLRVAGCCSQVLLPPDPQICGLVRIHHTQTTAHEAASGTGKSY